MLTVERWVKHCTFKHDFVTFHTGVKSRKKNNSENSSFTCRRHVCVMVLSFSFVISCFTHHFLSYFFQTPFLCRPGYVLPISTFVFKFVLQPLLVCLCFFSGLFSFHHSVVFLDSPLPAFQLPAFLSPALLLAFWILDLGFVIKTDFFVILPACLCAVLLGLSFTNWVWRIFNKLNIHPCNMVMSL